jgi:hypothetical protein
MTDPQGSAVPESWLSGVELARLGKLDDRIARLEEARRALLAQGQARASHVSRYPDGMVERAQAWMARRCPPEEEVRIDAAYYEVCFKYFMRRLSRRSAEADTRSE